MYHFCVHRRLVWASGIGQSGSIAPVLLTHNKPQHSRTFILKNSFILETGDWLMFLEIGPEIPACPYQQPCPTAD